MAKRREKKRKNRIVSLRFKAVSLILVAVTVLSTIAITISYNVYSSTMDKHYKALASNLARTAASQLDSDALLRYYDAVKEIEPYDDDKYWETTKNTANPMISKLIKSRMKNTTKCSTRFSK